MIFAVLGPAAHVLTPYHQNDNSDKRQSNCKPYEEPRRRDKAISYNPIIYVVCHPELSLSDMPLKIKAKGEVLTPNVFLTTVEVTIICPLIGL